MISGSEIKVLDRNAEYYGVPAHKLMENAGKGVADFIIKYLDSVNKNILVFCGLGNNGGDGFVAARYLAEKHNVTLFLTGLEKDIRTDISRKNFCKLKEISLEIHDIESISEIDRYLSEKNVIVDSMLGIGLSGSLRTPYSAIVEKINAAKKKTVISVDMPTGLGTDTAIKPEFTLTFHDVKNGMDRRNSGDIKILDIGIPKKAVECVGPGELLVYYPKPKKESHKGDNGSVLVIGGGPYIGAPAMTALAALRTGSDLAYIATPKRAERAISTFSPNLIVKDLNSEFLNNRDIPTIIGLLHICDTVIIGPGLGKLKETERAIIQLIDTVVERNKPLVIDADAIKPIGEQLELIKNSTTVVTPHEMEFKKLTSSDIPQNIDGRIETVQKWAEKLGISIFLKGYVDVLSDGEKTKLNKIHNEAMTVGGTGDVLAGVIGALLSKGVKPFNAMRIAAFLNGEAGNEIFRKKSYGLIATDIIEEIPVILKKYL